MNRGGYYSVYWKCIAPIGQVCGRCFLVGATVLGTIRVLPDGASVRVTKMMGQRPRAGEGEEKNKEQALSATP